MACHLGHISFKMSENCVQTIEQFSKQKFCITVKTRGFETFKTEDQEKSNKCYVICFFRKVTHLSAKRRKCKRNRRFFAKKKEDEVPCHEACIIYEKLSADQKF